MEKISHSNVWPFEKTRKMSCKIIDFKYLGLLKGSGPIM